MSKMDGCGSKSTDRPDWTHTYQALATLAPTLPKVDAQQPARVKVPAPGSLPLADLAPPPEVRDPLARQSAEIERAVADIGRAAAALRRAEPSLEPRLPDAQARTEPRNVRSVWILVGLTWLCTASVVSCAIAAVFLLFG
jgi:hypothetical protein